MRAISTKFRFLKRRIIQRANDEGYRDGHRDGHRDGYRDGYQDGTNDLPYDEYVWQRGEANHE
jgi:flagellar biosynthesis/type III secretory pathway protein FliH